MHQLLKSRVFSKHRVSIKSWIYNQVSEKILRYMIFLRELTYKIPVKEAFSVRNMIFNLRVLEFIFAFWIFFFTQKSHNRCSVSYLSVLRIRMFIPDPNFSILGSRRRIPDPDRNTKNLNIFNLKIVVKLLEIWSWIFVPDPDFFQAGSGSRGQSLGPGTGSATV